MVRLGRAVAQHSGSGVRQICSAGRQCGTGETGDQTEDQMSHEQSPELGPTRTEQTENAGQQLHAANPDTAWQTAERSLRHTLLA